MSLSVNDEVLISQSGNCHNGEPALVIRVTTLGAMVRVRECVHLYNRMNLRAVPPSDTIPEPAVV